MFAVCHNERNASVCFPLRLAAGHHMYVEQNIDHSACLFGKFNKPHTRSLSLWDGWEISEISAERSEVILSPST